MEGLIFIAAMLGLMWLLVLRPQRRRQAEHAELIANLNVGDEIVTAGGLYGRIQELGDEELTVEIAPDTSVRIARGAVAGVREPEEPETEEPPGG